MYCKKLFLALCFLCAVLTTSQIFSATYIVGPAETYKTIQSAYTVAGSGDTILLTAGYTYTGSGNVNLTFAKDLTLGRTGAGTDPIIDMKGSGRFCRIDSSSTATISNLVIQNGRATTGGAIYNNASFLYMFSCTFIDNTAVSPSRGGAVWSNGTSHATNCTFNNSYSSDYGGAICNDNGNFLTTDCTFNHNHAGTGGGAIANYQSNSNFQVAGCIFNDNDASGGGAVIDYGTFQATDCTFSNNKATGNFAGGGAINTSSSGSSSISCCRFVGNTAKVSGSTIQKLTGGVVTAQNCWWGTNYPNRKTLFNNTLAVSAYSPYITINLLPDPLFIPVGTPTLITADFTQNSTGESHGCTIMNGTPVIFSTDSLDTTVSPTLAYIVSGQAQTTLYDISETNTFSVCAKTDTDLSTTGYTYCETATPTIDPTEVYVSAIDGDDANLGDSPDNPVRTIQRGLDRLSQVSTNTLYLYLEQGNTFTGTGNKNLTITERNLTFTTYEHTHGGADPIIDMQGSGRFCTISTTATVSLNNLYITNGFISNNHGGAIYNNGTLNAFSCTFSSNSVTGASRYGGAIYGNGLGDSINLVSCIFYGNSTASYGGAVYRGLDGFLTLSGCTFDNNNAAYGGAVNIAASATIADCIFKNNNTTIFGAAIRLNGDASIARCTFNNNVSSSSGGTIYIVVGGNGTITDCSFNNNISGLNGGAIRNVGNLDASGCTFNGNQAINGGALYSSDATCAVTCCRFVDNTATTSAHAIYRASGTVTAQNCWWGTNYPDPTVLFDGTEVTYTPYIILNLLPEQLWPRVGCTLPITADFTQNSSGDSHGCTIMDGTPVIFSTNSLDITISPTFAYIVNGQAQTTLYDIPNTDTFSVCAKTDTDLSTTGYTYCETATPIDLTAVYVSALSGDDTNLGDSEANPVKTIQRGLDRLSCVSTGTLYLEQGNTFTGTSNKDLTITKTNLVITSYYGSYGSAAPIIDMEGSGRFCTIDTICSVTISNLAIRNGFVSDPEGYGGAILNNGTLAAFSCSFSGNYAQYEGGAIENYGNLKATECTFSNNNSDQYGGAIEIYGTTTLINCTFISNYAEYDGGAMEIYDQGRLYAVDCIFNTNTSHGGGAISNFTLAHVVGCLFNGNSAESGGAILNMEATTTVDSCLFINNRATAQEEAYGGAIYTSIFHGKKNGNTYQPSHTVYVYNSTFIGNSALYNGGALANFDDAAYLTGCTFQLNYAPQGGAVANTSNIATALLNGQSCTFIENSADLGGALFNAGTDAYATINCSRFADNTATSSGNAIYNEGDGVTSPTVDAEDNWWGSNADPSTTPNLLYGAIDADPWTTVTLTAIPLEGKGNFTIVATFSSCIPDGTPVAFSTTEGTITPSSSTSSGSATATLTDALYTATVCILVGPEDEQFSVCIIVPGPAPDYQFLPTSIDISTGTDAIYALDWCQQQPGTLQPPLLAAGGVIDDTSCAKPNIFVYSLDSICQSDENGPIDPRIMTITEQQFDSTIVNAVAWCCNNAICPMYPYLAVGGKTDNGTNTRVYTIDPRTYRLNSYASAPDNGLSSVTAVAWNPATNCKVLTIGGWQEEEACNIIAYRNLRGNIVTLDNTLFDSDITSLDWCKTNTLPAHIYAYLAVGATGTDSSIAVYQGVFR